MSVRCSLMIFALKAQLQTLMMHFSSSNFTYVCCLLPFTARLYTTAKQLSWLAKCFLKMIPCYAVLHYCVKLVLCIHVYTLYSAEAIHTR